MTKQHIGSNLNEFLEKENILAEVEALALKKILVFEFEKAMQEQNLTKTAVAERMNTSRAAVNRLLDPQNTSINLMSIEKAAVALGKKLLIQVRNS